MKVRISNPNMTGDKELDDYYKSIIGKVANVIDIRYNKLVLDISQYFDEEYSFWDLQEVEFYEK